MTIGNAMTFIKRGMHDSQLRERLNLAPTMAVRDEILLDEGMLFSQHQFEEAWRNQLTLCREAEAADQLKEFNMWWTLLDHLLGPSASPGICNGGPSETCRREETQL